MAPVSSFRLHLVKFCNIKCFTAVYVYFVLQTPRRLQILRVPEFGMYCTTQGFAKGVTIPTFMLDREFSKSVIGHL